MALAFEETGTYHKYSVSTHEPCALALFAITHCSQPFKKDGLGSFRVATH